MGQGDGNGYAAKVDGQISLYVDKFIPFSDERALNMTNERYASFYDELCNVIARVEFNISDEDPYSHTSDAARAGANRILGVLNEVGF